jgi:hypothetical protein
VKLMTDKREAVLGLAFPVCVLRRTTATTTTPVGTHADGRVRVVKEDEEEFAPEVLVSPLVVDEGAKAATGARERGRDAGVVGEKRRVDDDLFEEFGRERAKRRSSPPEVRHGWALFLL